MREVSPASAVFFLYLFVVVFCVFQSFTAFFVNSLGHDCVFGTINVKNKLFL